MRLPQGEIKNHPFPRSERSINSLASLRGAVAGCEYSDTLLAFRLLEATNLNDTDEKFVLTGVDYSEAQTLYLFIIKEHGFSCKL